jgi:hypothetical protein
VDIMKANVRVIVWQIDQFGSNMFELEHLR